MQNLIFERTNVSNDKNLFHHLKGNRYGGGKNQIANEKKQATDFANKVKELVKSMQKNGYNIDHPIEVALICGLLYILDGQHRYAAAIECGIDYHYIIKPNITTIKQANDYCERKNNAKRSTWNISEYIYRIVNDTETYPLETRKKYQQLVDWSKQYRLSFGLICDIAIGEGSTKTNGVIKKGIDFELKSDVVAIFDLATMIARKEFNELAVLTSRTFVRSVAKMFRHPYFTDEMLKRVKEKTFNFNVPDLKFDDYTQRMLEGVCNYRKHNNKIHLGKVSGTLR